MKWSKSIIEVCTSENLVAESEKMYRLITPDDETNIIGTVMMLFGKLKSFGMDDYLKELYIKYKQRKNYSRN